MKSVIIGSQWGDEGKGKIVDMLAKDYDMIVRYQGGNNAGHTVVIGDKTYKLHLIPSGILYPDKTNVLANGMVIDPDVLLKEMGSLGGEFNNFHISENAHVIMIYHKIIDNVKESSLGEKKIGTTGRGIGPCYADKIMRTGIRMQDLIKPEVLKEKIRRNIAQKKKEILYVYNVDEQEFMEIMQKPEYEQFYDENDIINVDAVFEHYIKLGQELKKYMTNTSLLICGAVEQNKNILFEGAQGTLLDIDHGTYPYVTSSNPSIGSVHTGTGCGSRIDNVIAIVKAYTTRVGSGSFVTELKDDIGIRLRENGKEFGTTTGRPRRCGWLDLVLLKHSHNLNYYTEVVITKLDVLTGLHSIKLCTSYDHEGSILKDFPTADDVLSRCRPVYEELPGWNQDISNVKTYDELPAEAKNYLDRIEQLLGVKISYVSVGPERNQTIKCTR